MQVTEIKDNHAKPVKLIYTDEKYIEALEEESRKGYDWNYERIINSALKFLVNTHSINKWGRKESSKYDNVEKGTTNEQIYRYAQGISLEVMLKYKNAFKLASEMEAKGWKVVGIRGGLEWCFKFILYTDDAKLYNEHCKDLGVSRITGYVKSEKHDLEIKNDTGEYMGLYVVILTPVAECESTFGFNIGFKADRDLKTIKLNGRTVYKGVSFGITGTSLSLHDTDTSIIDSDLSNIMSHSYNEDEDNGFSILRVRLSSYNDFELINCKVNEYIGVEICGIIQDSKVPEMIGAESEKCIDLSPFRYCLVDLLDDMPIGLEVHNLKSLLFGKYSIIRRKLQFKKLIANGIDITDRINSRNRKR